MVYVMLRNYRFFRIFAMFLYELCYELPEEISFVSFYSLCNIVLSFFNPPETPLDKVTNIDKVLHFLMYFGLCCVLWLEYFRCHRRFSVRRLVCGAVVAPILFSGLVEIGQQALTPNRAADWWDFLFNTLGCLVAAAFSLLVTRRVIKRLKMRGCTSEKLK